MRKITVGAIQPANLPIPDALYCLSDAFCGDAERILAQHCHAHLEITASLLEQCGQAGCTIVTTSEDICGLSAYLTADPALFGALVDGSARMAEERLSAIARRYGMYVIGCYTQRIDSKIYNAASVFGRDGAIVGRSKKTHIPPDEMWQVEDGEEIDVIPLDFGRIGVCICYDMMFPEMMSVLALRGAEIVFHPTGGYGWYDSIGEATLRTRANDNSVYIVTAKNYFPNGAGHSSVIDRWGLVLADAGFYENVIVYKQIDLDAPKAQPDWFYPSQMSGIAQVDVRKLAERRPELYAPLSQKLHDRMAAPSEARKQELREKVKKGLCRW